MNKYRKLISLGDTVFAIFTVSIIILFAIMLFKSMPLHVNSAIRVLEEHDGEFIMGNAALHMDETSHSEDEQDVYRVFTVTIDNEVVKEVTHKGTSGDLDFDEYSNLINREVRKEYEEIMRESNEVKIAKKQRKENVKKLKEAIRGLNKVRTVDRAIKNA